MINIKYITVLFLAAITLHACDWEYYALVNSLPVHGNPKNNPVVHVFLGIDGNSYWSTQEAMSRGAFKGFHLSKFISVFPGTSEAGWSRLLHAQPVKGYEYQYYNPDEDKVIRSGYYGVLLHAVPPLEFLPMYHPDYYNAFDFQANGYTATYYAYRDTFWSYGNTLDNIFLTLAGRAETTSSFFAYIPEIDIMGHMQTHEDVINALMELSDRIEKFKKNHPERKFLFTFFSDHGMDFVKVTEDGMIEFDKELKKQDIKVVDSLNDHDPDTELFAIPIIHTRVTYLAIHTNKKLTEEIAKRSSLSKYIDMAVARSPAPDGASFENELEWYGLWSNGKKKVYYGFDPENDLYYLPKDCDWNWLDVGLTFEKDEEYKVISDEEGFKLTMNNKYPDVFYKARTAINKYGVVFPCEVMISFAHPYASIGFKIPGGANEIASSGFHGAIDYMGSVSGLATEERELPPAVRTDNLLSFFPELRTHLEQNRNMTLDDPYPNESLDYSEIFDE